MRSKSAVHRIAHAFAGIDRDRTLAKVVQWKYMHLQTGSEHPPRPTPLRLPGPTPRTPSTRRPRPPRPPTSLTEKRRSVGGSPGPPRRPKRLTRQRLGPGTSRGRPGARHPPLRCDTATPGRLPGDLRHRLEHDGQARCSRPGWASLPGPFALAQSASPAAAPGTGSSPKEEVRLDSLGGWCLRHQCVTGGGQRMSE